MTKVGMRTPRWLGARIARDAARRGSLALGAGLVVVASVLLLDSMPRAAAQSSEVIHGYDVVIRVEDDGSMVVDETIEYDFGSAQRHGILRDIPVRLRYDDRYDRVYDLDVLEVSASPGTPAQYQEEHPGGGLLRLRIGDPDQTITGSHTYRIRYRVRGALNGFEDHDELFWNAIGGEWSAPISSAIVTVVMPGVVTSIACYAGPTGSRLPCDEAAFDGDTARFAHRGLGSFQAMSVVVALPKGVVPAPTPILDERWSLGRAFTVNRWTVAASAALFAITGFVVTRLLWLGGRDRRWAGSAVDIVYGSDGGEERAVGLFDGGPYPVEFTPPEGLRPGEIGTLEDEIAHPLDVTATIVDLAVRGYLTIEEIEPTGLLSGLFGKTDWKLTRTEKTGDLARFEELLLDGLFEDGDEVQLSDLKTKFVTRLKRVQDALYASVVAHGWFLRSPATTRNIWLGIGLGAFAAGIAIEVAAIAFTKLALVPLALPLFGFVVLAAHRAMPRRTARGTAALTRIRGFKRYIETAERDRARFAENANLFFEYLPFAIVFGATDKWAKAFEGLAQQPSNPAWYSGTHAFAATSFADSMGAFTVASSGTIASTPGGSGSSGFSGGAGGGGGGGGGGSW
ncbi:MAG: DUF2207 domain-containing protein [Dehalococcoidia bacterium]